MTARNAARWAAAASIGLALMSTSAACAPKPAAAAVATSGSGQLAAASNAATAAAASKAAAVASAMPGADPSIQRWFLQIDKAKTAFNAALFKARLAIESGRNATDCQPLADSAAKIQAALPSLRRAAPEAGAKIADAVLPLMDTMAKVADACLAENFKGAHDLLTQFAIPQQGEVQTEIDEILDGDI